MEDDLIVIDPEHLIKRLFPKNMLPMTICKYLPEIMPDNKEEPLKQAEKGKE